MIRWLSVFSHQLYVLGDESFIGDVAIKLGRHPHLQELALHQVGLTHHDVRATPVLQKTVLLVLKPLLYCRLQMLPLLRC